MRLAEEDRWAFSFAASPSVHCGIEALGLMLGTGGFFRMLMLLLLLLLMMMMIQIICFFCFFYMRVLRLLVVRSSGPQIRMWGLEGASIAPTSCCGGRLAWRYPCGCMRE